MLLEVLIPIRITTGHDWWLPFVILAGIFNAVITLVMVFAITYAIHRGWNAV